MIERVPGAKMKKGKAFDELFSKNELRVFLRVDSPNKIQSFLDALPYSTGDRYRCPRSVLRDREGDCFDGALFAAAALRRIGHPPLILNLLPNARDDDHVVALYKRDGCWGAVAKSNFAGLRFREPIYRTLRELVMSYFELYYNVMGEKTLRSYTVPLNLQAFDHLNWMASDEHLEVIARRLDKIRRIPLVTRRMAARLSLVDKRSYKAGLLGANIAGIYKPPRKGGR
jgi:hypothetical protein